MSGGVIGKVMTSYDETLEWKEEGGITPEETEVVHSN